MSGVTIRLKRNVFDRLRTNATVWGTTALNLWEYSVLGHPKQRIGQAITGRHKCTRMLKNKLPTFNTAVLQRRFAGARPMVLRMPSGYPCLIKTAGFFTKQGQL